MKRYFYIILNSVLYYELCFVIIIIFLFYRGVGDIFRNGYLYVDGCVYGESGCFSVRNEIL